MTPRLNNQIQALVAMIASISAAPNQLLSQIPGGYEVIQLTDAPGVHSRPAINNAGEVVWSTSLTAEDISDIYRFQQGIVSAIPGQETYNVYPSINNLGAIAWRQCEGFDGAGCQIGLHIDGVTSSMPVPATVDASLSINDNGHIVWPHNFSDSPNHSELFSYNGKRIEQITNLGHSNAIPRMNNHGEIVWTRVDFSQSPWQSTIMLYSKGEIAVISGLTEQPGSPDINDSGVVVWGSANAGIEMWDNGTVTTITTDGRAPKINNTGQISFARWNETSSKWSVWLYDDGQFYKISHPDHISAVDSDINDHGEVTWHAFVNQFGDAGIFLMRKLPAIPAISELGLFALATVIGIGGMVILRARLSN